VAGSGIPSRTDLAPARSKGRCRRTLPAPTTISSGLLARRAADVEESGGSPTWTLDHRIRPWRPPRSCGQPLHPRGAARDAPRRSLPDVGREELLAFGRQAQHLGAKGNVSPERFQRLRLGRATAASLRFSRAFFFFLRSFRQRFTGLEPRPIASDPSESGVEHESGVAAVNRTHDLPSERCASPRSCRTSA